MMLRPISIAVVLIAAGLAVGCQHENGADKKHDTDKVPMADYTYYTGSDADSDYFVILDGPGGKKHPYALDRNPTAWPNPMPRTSDPRQWRLVPGSAAP